ncbi:MAG: DNA repair protein RadC [Eubacteriales bacterium]|nr:DNA repair protein RadC [Eubacteriales bacterium]
MTHIRLEDLPEHERPYERLYHIGVEVLSDRELLSIILQSGHAGSSSLNLAEEILHDVGELGLSGLSRYQAQEFERYRGIGRAKAVRLCAAFELGRRAQFKPLRPREVLNSPLRIRDFMAPLLQDLEHEEIHILYLDVRARLIRRQRLSRGGLGECRVDLRQLCREALRANASAAVLLHNHPSGDVSPSESDRIATREVEKALKSIGIELFDHLVLARESYYSFRAQGDL